jgi:hypothetical protein
LAKPRNQPSPALSSQAADITQLNFGADTKTKAEPVDEMKMKEADFDASKALGVAAPLDDEENPAKRLCSYPPKKREKS